MQAAPPGYGATGGATGSWCRLPREGEARGSWTDLSLLVQTDHTLSVMGEGDLYYHEYLRIQTYYGPVYYHIFYAENNHNTGSFKIWLKIFGLVSLFFRSYQMISS